MSEVRETLTKQLIHTLEEKKFSNVHGHMRSEHSIFIPDELLKDKSEEIKEFMTTLKEIKTNPYFNLSVKAEPLKGRIRGIEFVMEFFDDTDYDGVIQFIKGRG